MIVAPEGLVARGAPRALATMLVAAAVGAGCAKPASVTGVGATASQLIVSPKAATLFLNQTLDFTAVGLTSSGDTATVTVTWSVTSGHMIDTTTSGSRHHGRYRAGPSPGQVEVVATGQPGGASDTALVTVTLVPVTSVTVTPSNVGLLAGQTVQLTATAQDSVGDTLPGRVFTWMSDAPGVATVSATGLVSAVAAGSATVSATSETTRGSALITVTAAPPPTTGSCLQQTGPTISVSGVQTSNYENTSLADNTKIDASTAQFLTGTAVPVHIGGVNVCYHGGEIIGQWPPSTPWGFAYTTYGIVVSGLNTTVENIALFNYGNGVSMDQNGANFTVRSSFISYGRDGSIENDFDVSGTVDDVLIESYAPFVAEEYVSGLDGSNNLETIRNSLAHLEPMDGVYSGTVPGTDGMFVWGPNGPKLALYNNIFRVDQNSNEPYLAPPPGKLADCEANIMIWLGSGPFPETLPATFNGKPCFTLMTGQAGLDYWNNAVAQWKANHPNLLPDIGPPVVSLFSPGIVGATTLAGTVNLTATAADDRQVAGVQFQLDGQNIGPELTIDAPVSKYTLTWDSHAVANGNHTLTATARDPAGHTTTSAGVMVTVSN